MEVDQFKLLPKLFIIFHTDHGINLVVELPDEIGALADFCLELFDCFFETDDLEFGFDSVVVLFEGLDAGGDQEGLGLSLEVQLLDVLFQGIDLGFGLSLKFAVLIFELVFG